MAPLETLLGFTVIENTVVEILHYFFQPEKNDVHRDELIRKMQYMYTVEYYSPMNRNINMESVHKWVDLEKIMLIRIIQAQKYKHFSFDMCILASNLLLCVAFRHREIKLQAIRRLLDGWLVFLVPENVLTVASEENTSVVLTGVEHYMLQPQLVR